MCQACHGSAAEHLKDPVKNKMTANPFQKGATADQRTAVCQTCHSGNRNLAFWTSGKHELNDVTCSNCHSIHGKALAPTINKFVTTFRPNQAEMCANCHQPIRAATLKPSHHPIPEGKVKCTDCHNPHGALTPAMVKQPTINDQCYSCHADKRGPYVFNHPPVEENCATCHNPHGSVHAKLLNESAPNLCQDCHDWSRHPGTIYGAAGALQLPARRQLAGLREQDRAAQLRRQQPAGGAVVPQLPQLDPRLECAGEPRQVLHAIRSGENHEQEAAVHSHRQPVRVRAGTRPE